MPESEECVCSALESGETVALSPLLPPLSTCAVSASPCPASLSLPLSSPCPTSLGLPLSSSMLGVALVASKMSLRAGLAAGARGRGACCESQRGNHVHS